MKTRKQHLEWCKQRAVSYCDSGDISGALASMFSDLEKHPDTAGHLGSKLGMSMLMTGHLSQLQQVKDFINGFN